MRRTFLPVRVTVLAAVVALAAFQAPAARAQTVLVQPYVQPGDGRTLTGTDVKVIRWFTDQMPGEFVVEYSTPGGKVHTVRPTRFALDFPLYKPEPKKKEAVKDAKERVKKAKKSDEERDPRAPLPPETEQHYFRYTANLDGLPFNSDVTYRVKLGDRVVREATFRTRATADKSVRCVLVGDMAQGREVQKPVAYEISKQKPDFLVALGDIVYPTGRINQYMSYFWGTYNNVAEAGPKSGAPLMAGVPFYAVLGNHDVSAKLPTVPDALAAYYFFAPPKGGPGEGPWITPLGDDTAVAAKFRAAAADSYPNLDAYSFDNGPAHFVVINDNRPMKIMDPAFLKWLSHDLKSTTARWKIVCFHIPGFHSSKQHYPEQQIRPLQPLFEECGVDLTFAGHVHNYQRTLPLRFVPDPKQEKKGQVDGKFTLDTAFDGKKNTRPDGVIHVVAGGGGASLYGPGLDKTAELLRKEYGANYADFTANLVADRHSFVVLDIAPDRLQLRAINETGDELDRIVLTKGK
jgi:acid phosphatase type 7